VDYSIRPAKHVLRKMLCDVFKRLIHFDSLGAYEYIGFGATELIDFSVFHKTLGIHNMTSIESEEETYERARTYNLPYGCITVIHGKSTDKLPSVGHGGKAIYWLDYTSVLNETVLADVDIVCKRARSGSILLVTVNSDLRNDRLAKFTKDVGEGNVPLGTTEEDLKDWGAARVQKRVLRNKVEESLRLRNLVGAERVLAKDILHIHYKDSSRMLTYGILLHEKNDKFKLKKCRFHDLPFARGEEFLLKVPSLTRRERHVLDQYLPTPGLVHDQHPWLREDFEEYKSLYRFYPNFGDVEQQ
jgi:hypothetical protein